MGSRLVILERLQCRASFVGLTTKPSTVLKDKSESGPLWKHSVEHHDAREDVVYTMKVMRNHPTALTRQIEESVAIEKKKVHVLMNSKGEWNSQRIPRIVVQVQGRDEEEEGERLPTLQKSICKANRRNCHCARI